MTTPISKKGGTWVKLLSREALIQHQALSVGVQSRYTCRSPQELKEVCDYLEKRARAMAEANPFLVGRLRTHPFTRLAALWIPDEADRDYNSFFQVKFVAENDKLTTGLEGCAVGRGKDCQDKDLPIFKLRVIRSVKDSNEFLLVLTMAHTVGDIAALYAVWGQLNPKASITKLEIERPSGFPGCHVSNLKGNNWKRLLYWFLISDLSPVRAIVPCLKPKRPPIPGVMAAHHVNMEWVEARKKAHDPTTPGVPYLSTVAVISEWFFSQLSPSVAVMAFNMRGRHPAATSKHVGNYLDVLSLFPDQYSATNIRRAIASLGEHQPKPFLRSGPGFSAAQVTGWNSAYQHVDLPGCTHVQHEPYRNKGAGVVMNNLILFKTSETGFGVITVTYGPLKDTSPLGEPIPGISPFDDDTIENGGEHESLLEETGRAGLLRQRKTA